MDLSIHVMGWTLGAALVWNWVHASNGHGTEQESVSHKNPFEKIASKVVSTCLGHLELFWFQMVGTLLCHCRSIHILLLLWPHTVPSQRCHFLLSLWKWFFISILWTASEMNSKCKSQVILCNFSPYPSKRAEQQIEIVIDPPSQGGIFVPLVLIETRMESYVNVYEELLNSEISKFSYPVSSFLQHHAR